MGNISNLELIILKWLGRFISEKLKFPKTLVVRDWKERNKNRGFHEYQTRNAVNTIPNDPYK